MSGFIFLPIVRVRNVRFLAILRNVVCTNCRGAGLDDGEGERAYTAYAPHFDIFAFAFVWFRFCTKCLVSLLYEMSGFGFWAVGVWIE